MTKKLTDKQKFKVAEKALNLLINALIDLKNNDIQYPEHFIARVLKRFDKYGYQIWGPHD